MTGEGPLPAFTPAPIPRVEAHCHIAGLENMAKFATLRQAVLDEVGADIAVWVDLSAPLEPGADTSYLAQVHQLYGGHFLSSINDYRIPDGLRFPPDELSLWKERGVVGYKLWAALRKGDPNWYAVDAPEMEPTFAAMEAIGMPATALHIAFPTAAFDPWGAYVVDYWRAQMAWQRVLERHPRLIAVNAHMLFATSTDQQLDYLAALLDRYANLHVDTAETCFGFFHLLDYNHVRDFFITFADRIIFAGDMGWNDDRALIGQHVLGRQGHYASLFRLLETDETIWKMKGLALDRDVLERIYWKNAARVYPRVAEAMASFGHRAGGTDGCRPAA